MQKGVCWLSGCWVLDVDCCVCMEDLMLPMVARCYSSLPISAPHYPLLLQLSSTVGSWCLRPDWLCQMNESGMERHRHWLDS